MGKVLAFATKSLVAGALLFSSVSASALQCAPGTPGCVQPTADAADTAEKSGGGFGWLLPTLFALGVIVAGVMLAKDNDKPASP